MSVHRPDSVPEVKGGGTLRWGPAVAALLVCLCSAIVASSGVIVTAGGNDQRDFHWVTVEYLRGIWPRVDVVNLYTATGPLYHLVLAAVSEPLNLSQSATQFVGSMFAACLAAAALWFAQSVRSASLRMLAVAPLLLSPYFWQSTLWMCNDAAALLFGFLALVVTLRQQPSTTRSQLGVGFLIAAAIATRQSYVWLVIPAAAVAIYGTYGSSSVQTKCAAVVRIAAPGVTLLTVLFALWHGFSPPLTQEMNASRLSWVSISYCFAVAAVFFVPILFAVGIRKVSRQTTTVAVAVATAIPALVFESAATTPPDNSRRGSLIWILVAHSPTLADRSPLLFLLAFIGALAVCLVVLNLDRRTATLVGSGLLALSVAMIAGGRLYQKYFELPIAAFALITIVGLASGALALRRRWPLVVLAAFQAVLVAGVVIWPVISAL